MARHMTGETAPIEAVWRQKILGLIDPETGLLTRPRDELFEEGRRRRRPGAHALCAGDRLRRRARP